MIKEQDHPDNSQQLWTFKDQACTFFVKKNKNLFRFKLSNIFTNQWHQSEDVELQRINEQTIKAAFDPKVESVSYELTPKSEKSINLQFKVKIEYLATNFYEDIELKEIEMDQKQQIKMQTEELVNETKKLEALLEREISNNTKNVYLESSAFNTRNGKMFTVRLNPGKYAFSATGAYISEKFYNGEYYDDGQQGNEYNHLSVPLRLIIDTVEQEKLEFVSTTPKFMESYEYPYVISGIFEVKKQNEVNFIFDGYKNSEALIMNTNLLTVSFISQLNDLV